MSRGTRVARTASAPSHEGQIERPAGQRVIDLVHLARQTLGDRGLEHEVLRIFDQGAKTYLLRLRNAQSPDEIKLALHSLKGASAGVGANGIAALAVAAEAEFRDTGAVADETVADIGFAVEEVHLFIAELLQD